MDRRYAENLAFAQEDELEKIALSPVNPWIGRIAGGLLGAGTTGLAGYHTAAPGEEISGAIKGGLLGAGLGALGGQAATARGRAQLQRLGQRQLHGATGYLPGRGLFGRGPEGTKWWQLGKTTKITPKERVKSLRQMKMDLPENIPSIGESQEKVRKSLLGRLAGAGNTQTGAKVQDWLARRNLARGEARMGLAEHGMTSLPGLAKAYMGKTPGVTPYKALKINVAAPGLAFGAGLPLYGAAESIRGYQQSGDKSELAGGIGSNLGYAIAGGLPIGATIALGTLAQKGATSAAQGIQSLLKKREE